MKTFSPMLLIQAGSPWLPVKKWVLGTGKLLPGGLPRVVTDMASVFTVPIKLWLFSNLTVPRSSSSGVRIVLDYPFNVCSFFFRFFSVSSTYKHPRH